MTEIALRTYNQEIKDLIDHAHFDEAIAHCQHILETFPRHIETYQLLGKAFLEQGRHGDAADVFQRVLSAIPEDWLAHVAMAIVREDESNLDMAIWHMERAYEVNPSNPTVQQEVRRLRGRRDGVEPPKLRLTRSALARMYIKGGLYGQAIAEIRSALAEDPDRPDLQTLLASALYDSGSIQEAADICSALLQKLPYCMEANRVLGLALLASDKKVDAEKLFQRMESLDPHIDVETLKKEKRIAEHPAQTITLSRLEYEGQEKTVRTKQPSWASSLGLKIEEPQQRQNIPDWLAAASQQQPPLSSAPRPAASAGPRAEVPSWIDQATAAMSSSGESGMSMGGPSEVPPVPAAEPIARTATGELPDWIQPQAVPAEPLREETPSRSLPDWLSASAMPPPSEPAAPTTGGALPDWIKTASLPPDAPKEQISGIPDWLSTPPPPSVEGLPSTSLPEWTRPETKTGPLDVEPGNIPDWLNSSQPTSADLGPEPEWLKQTTSAGPASESIPEWMKGVTPTEPSSSVQQPSENVPDWLSEAPALPSKPVEMVPDWMRSDTPTVPSAARAQFFAQAAPSEDIPEWMKPEPAESPISFPPAPVPGAKPEKASGIPERAPLQAAPTAVPEVSLPDWMTAFTPETAPSPVKPAGEVADAVPADSFPDWLAAAAPDSALPPVESSSSAVPEVTAPDWLNPPETPAPSAVKPAEIAPQAAPPAPIEPSPIPTETAEADAEPVPEIALPDWLKAVPAPAPPSPESVETQADDVSEVNLPDWLIGGPAQPAAVTPVQARPEPEPITPPKPPAAEIERVLPSPLPPIVETTPPSSPSEPGPTHVTPTTSEGIDLPEWLVAQLQGKPKEPAQTPSGGTPSEPLPDWLKSSAQASAAPPVVDWDKAASQPVPAAPVDATRPASGLSSAPAEKSGTGAGEVPGWLDKSKPTGSDTVARWLDRRLKTSTLSSLDENALKGGTKPVPSTPAGRPGAGSTQLPTWLDSQKPGGSDTVVRWMDKRETGSLRKPQTATFSSVPKTVSPPQAEKPASPLESIPAIPAAAPAPVSGSEDTVASKRAAPQGLPVPSQPVAEQAAPVPLPKAPLLPPRPPAAEAGRAPQAIARPAPSAAPEEDEEEGAFVPPPEWLQKALGSAVAEVPPIPKKQTGGLTPGTVSTTIPAPVERKPAAVQPEATPVEEPAPAPAVKPGSWVPISPAPAVSAKKIEKPAKKAVRKKTRKLTDIESEALIREARVYLETDLQKASDAYQKVIEDPASADVVAGDLMTYLEQDPASPQLWNLLGDACSRAGRLQDAYRAYAEALRRM